MDDNFSSQQIVMNTQPSCSICQAKIEPGQDYCHELALLCENCCMDVRTKRIRKTHWQYLRSIKTEYLIDA